MRARPSPNVVIVGAGIFGLMAAWALARSGHSVTIIDQGEIPNQASASFDQHRLFHDFESDLGDATLLWHSAVAGWTELWRELGSTYWVPAPALAVSTAPGDLADRSTALIGRNGVHRRLLDHNNLVRRYPQLSFDKARFGVISEGGSLLLADKIVGALARRLIDLGARVVGQERVQTIDHERCAAVLSNGQAIAGDFLIISTGAWTDQLVPSLARRIRPHRQVVVYPAMPQHVLSHWCHSPIIVNLGDDKGLWIAPPLGGSNLKLAASCHGRSGAPESIRDRTVDDDEAGQVLGCFEGVLTAWSEYRLWRQRACLYSMSVNRALVMETLGESSGRIWVVCGCCGQGFKFAPIIAAMIVDVVDQRRSPAACMHDVGLTIPMTTPASVKSSDQSTTVLN